MLPLKIIFTTDSIKRGGKERQLTLLFALLSEKYSFHILAKSSDNSNHYLHEYHIPERNIFYYENFHELKNQIKKITPDVVISWDIKSSIYLLLLNLTCHFVFINGTIRHGIRLPKLSHMLRSLLCHISPFIIANSLAGLKANNLKPGKRRFVMYNGVEKKFLNFNSNIPNKSKRTSLIPGYDQKPGVVFITVSNLVPFKDHFSVLKALHDLKKSHNFYYFIVGDGPLRSQIEFMIRDLQLEKNVILTGRIENVSDYLFISDIMIHSSRGEGISNAILEGMYAGLPIIATNVGGIPETVYPGSSMLFPYQDDKALLDCLLKAPEVFAAFDPNSEDYKKHLARFSVDSMIRRFEEIIEEVVK